MSKALVTITLLLLSSIALTGCMQNNQNSDATPTPVDDSEDIIINDNDIIIEDDNLITPIPTDDNAMDTDADQVQVTIDSTSFKFEPNVIEAKPGQTVTVVLNNIEGFHDFVIDELAVKTMQIDGAGTDTVTFTIPETDVAGATYEFYCSVGEHRQMGMVGTLMIV